MKEIFYNIPEFKGYYYPYDDDKILEELFSNTVFMPYNPEEKLFGYTQKLIAKVYIAANFSKKRKFILEELINFFANLLITILHEQFRHYLKMLIFYNSFIYNKNIELLSKTDLPIDKDDEIYLNILKYTEKYNNKNSNTLELPNEVDGGHRLEILLLGKIIGNLFVIASFNLFKKSTWKKSLKDHLKYIIKINSNVESKELMAEKKKLEKISVDTIKNDKDYCEFLKLLIEEYASNKEIEFNKDITINVGYSSSRKKLDFYNEDNGLILNLNYSTFRENFGKDCNM